MRHPVIDVDIESYVSKVLSSQSVADGRLKPLFAIVTGMGRGKTRTLVELKKRLNVVPHVLCLAITFNNLILRPDAPSSFFTLSFQYAVNIIARIISVNYQIPYDLKFVSKLLAAISKLHPDSYSESDLIRELVKYMINQYTSSGKIITQFVLLVDESVRIQEELDSSNRNDVHRLMRDCLLSIPITIMNGQQLKVDLVMSG
jgi:hypothetical protein